jgi:uncharacterized protein YdhG (YjbR/CyaY superfamily)
MQTGKRVKPDDVESYFHMIPKEAQATLKKLQGTIHKIMPGAPEVISYQIPTIKYKGKPLIAYAGYKNHCSLYTISKALIKKMDKQLAKYETSGVTIQFPVNKPLPATLVKKIIQERIREIDDQ